MRAVWSLLAVITRLPSGLNVAPKSGAVWPINSATVCPVLVSQTRAVPSSLAVTIDSPSGLNFALTTAPQWPATK